MNTQKVFTKSLEGRLDPHFYKPFFIALNKKLMKSKHKILDNVIQFSNEVWNQKDFFENEFPYIEISEIDTISGDINNISYLNKQDAPSRAKMIVQENDIIVSTTRPHRGAISLLDKDRDNYIASTGFAVLRDLKTKDINRLYLYYFLRTNLSLNQLLQRSSGGSYPAITGEELKKIIIPIPTSEIQKKVIELMQSAYKERAEKIKQAEKLFNSINDYVREQIGIDYTEPEEKPTFIASSDEVGGKRLDPKKYSQKPKAILTAIRKARYSQLPLNNLIIANLSGEWGNDIFDKDTKENNDTVQVKVLRNTNFDNSLNLNLDDVAERLINKSKFKKIKLQDGDILIEKSGGSPIQPVGRVAIFDNIQGDYCFSNFLQCIRINTTKCLPYYLFVYLKAIYGLNYMEYLQNQTTGIKNLIWEEFIDIPVVLPPKDVQEKLAEETKNKIAKAIALKHEASTVLEDAKKKVEEMILN